jgi:5-hydroxyisourate hydrolase-like protein (transthyretin family)
MSDREDAVKKGVCLIRRGVLLFLLFSGLSYSTVFYSVMGTVTDEETGKGIPNVRINLYGRDNYTALTDKNGWFQISDLPEKYEYRMEIGAIAPYSSPLKSWTIRFANAVKEMINVTLSRGGVISGRVVNAQGAPIAGVEIKAKQMKAGLGYAKTDEFGRYTVGANPAAGSALGAGEGYFLTAEYFEPGLADKVLTDITVVKDSVTQVPDIVFDPDDITGIEGEVVSAINGKPINNAVVRLRDRSMWEKIGPSSLLAYLETDKSGLFRIKNIVPGDYRISIAPPHLYDRTDDQFEALSFETSITISHGICEKLLISLNIPSQVEYRGNDSGATH